jgi:hypothetical protein
LVTKLPFWWRVSRYDPALRDDRGSYTRETWTSIADVGRAYQGRLVTRQEYDRVESWYLEAMTAFAREARVRHLEVRSLETPDSGLREGKVVTISAATNVLRDMLREEIACKLESPTDDFAVHVGFDLYMYVGADRPCPRAISLATNRGLYVEPDRPSPQLPDV